MISLYVTKVILNRNSQSTGLDDIKIFPLCVCVCVSNLQISPMVSTFHIVLIPFLHDESVDLKRKTHVKSCFHILTKRLGENSASQKWVSWAQWARGWWRFVRITCFQEHKEKWREFCCCYFIANIWFLYGGVILSRLPCRYSGREIWGYLTYVMTSAVCVIRRKVVEIKMPASEPAELK